MQGFCVLWTLIDCIIGLTDDSKGEKKNRKISMDYRNKLHKRWTNLMFNISTLISFIKRGITPLWLWHKRTECNLLLELFPLLLPSLLLSLLCLWSLHKLFLLRPVSSLPQDPEYSVNKINDISPGPVQQHSSKRIMWGSICNSSHGSNHLTFTNNDH